VITEKWRKEGRASPTVSVIIPTRDYGRYIRQAVESIRSQTWTDWECLVVDDGSSDDTREILTELTAADPRIVYLTQESRGPSAARNAGLDAASGEFIQFLDADDLVGPRKLERQLQLLSEFPATDIVYGAARYFSDLEAVDGTPPPAGVWLDSPHFHTASGDGESVLPILLRDNFIAVHAALVRRSLLERVGGFDGRLRRMEDWDCWLRCALEGAKFLEDDVADAGTLSYVRAHTGGLSQNQLAMAKSALRVRRSIHGKLPTAQLRRVNEMKTHELWAGIGVLEGMGRHPGAGRRYLLRAALAERRIKWLAWAVLIPFLRQRPGEWALRRWREIRNGRLTRASSRDTAPGGPVRASRRS
jgi:glycosyltransferase involved in cell wall biosynthesis